MIHLVKQVIAKALLLLIFLPLQGQTAELVQELPASKGALGIGVGIPYGGLGISGEFNVFQGLSLTAGVGTMLTNGGYSAGVKYTLFNPAKAMRPTVTLLYGVNGRIIARDDSLTHITEAQHGITGALGAQWMFGARLNHGIEVRIAGIITTTMDERIDELEQQGYGPFTRGSRFDYAVGYRYAF